MLRLLILTLGLAIWSAGCGGDGAATGRPPAPFPMPPVPIAEE